MKVGNTSPCCVPDESFFSQPQMEMGLEMICPKCGRSSAPTQVICSVCDYILDPSFLFVEGDEKQALPADATQEIPALIDAKAHEHDFPFEKRVRSLDGSKEPGERVPEAEWMDWLLEPTFEPTADAQAAGQATDADPVNRGDPELADWLLEPSIDDAIFPTEPRVETDRNDAHSLDGMLQSQTDAVLLGDLHEEYDLVVTQDANWFLTAATEDVERPVQSVPLYLSKSVREMLRPEAVLACEPSVDVVLTPFEEHILQFLDGRRPLGRVAVLSELAQQDLEIAVTMLAEKRVVRLVGQAVPDLEKAAPAERSGAGHSVPHENHPSPAPDYNESAAPKAHESATPKPAPVFPSTPVNHSTSPPPPVSAARRPSSTLRQKQVAKRLSQPSQGSGPAPISPQTKSAARLRRTPSTQIETALFEKAKLEEESGNHQEAVRLLQRCIEDQPNVAGFHNRLGVLLAARLKDYHTAIVHLTRATELQPDNPTYRNNLGKIIAAAAAEGENSGPSNAAQSGGFWSAIKKIF